MVRLLAERSDTKSNVKLGRFRSQLQASYVSSHIEVLWYNETVCGWLYIKKILKIRIFLFKAWTDLKSWLIVPKGQLNARQLFLILKVSEFISFFSCQLISSIIMIKRVISYNIFFQSLF